MTDRKNSELPTKYQGLRKISGKEKYKLVHPPEGEWRPHGVRIPVKPELGLEINGDIYAIKLYFNKSERLSKNRTEMILLPSPGLGDFEEYLRTVPDLQNPREATGTSPEVDPSLYPREYRKNLHEPPSSAGKTDIGGI